MQVSASPAGRESRRVELKDAQAIELIIAGGDGKWELGPQTRGGGSPKFDLYFLVSCVRRSSRACVDFFGTARAPT